MNEKQRQQLGQEFLDDLSIINDAIAFVEDERMTIYWNNMLKKRGLQSLSADLVRIRDRHQQRRQALATARVVEGRVVFAQGFEGEEETEEKADGAGTNNS